MPLESILMGPVISPSWIRPAVSHDLVALPVDQIALVIQVKGSVSGVGGTNWRSGS